MKIKYYDLNHITMNSSQKKKIKALAHHLDPVFNIGKEGFTKGAAYSISENFKKNELIKVKFSQYKDKKKEIAEEIAIKTNSQLISIIGNILILYKKSKDPQNRQIKV